MKVLLQRVNHARVEAEGQRLGEIRQGLVAFVGVGRGDGRGQADWLAQKTVHLRIFDDQDGRSNLSLMDIQGQVLVVSQFTLYADTDRGRRPSYVHAAVPELAEPLVTRYAERVGQHGLHVEQGRFGAEMTVLIENHGPVTVLLERKPDG